MGDVVRFAIVTNCTNRKRGQTTVRARDVDARTPASFARKWGAALRGATGKHRLDELYVGRGFGLAKTAADILRNSVKVPVDFFIGSAGLGLKRAEETAPNYGLTISPGHEDSVTDLLGIRAEDWWQHISGDQDRLLGIVPPRAVAVVSLSARYFEMMQADLEEFAIKRPGKLRLIVRSADRLSSEALEAARLPYDARLNGPESSLQGTEADFCSRALNHFVKNVLSATPGDDVDQHRKSVEKALRKWTRPPPIRRQAMSNDEILAILRDLDPSIGSGRALRILRDEKQIACEQGRFKDLFAQARAQTRRQPRLL